MRQLVWSLVFGCVACVQADISFGDLQSRIVIDEGSSFVVNTPLVVSGTLVNNGSVTVGNGGALDHSQGTFIDHGGIILSYSSDATLTQDIQLSSLSTLTAAVGGQGGIIVLTGTGQKIIFSDNVEGQLIVGANTRLELNGVELVGYTEGAVTLGSGATLRLVASSLTLTNDVTNFNMSMFFEADTASPPRPSYIYGNGNSLQLGTGVLCVADDASLIIENVCFSAASGTRFLVEPDGELTLRNCTFQLAGEFVFPTGTLIIQDRVTLTGSGAFTYSSPEVLTIKAFSQLLVKGALFSYASDEDGSSVIQGSGNARTAEICLEGGQFTSRVPNLFLYNMRLMNKGNSVLSSLPFDGAQGQDDFQGAVKLGDGTNSNRNSELKLSTGTLLLSNIVLNVLDY